MNNYRASAMAWWNHDLVKFEQYELCKKHYPNREPHTLTGREIEKLWKAS